MAAKRFAVPVFGRVAAAALLAWAACGPAEPVSEEVPGPGGAEEYSFEYGLELEDERVAAGSRPVGTDFRFRSGDGFRLAFRADFDAYLYLFNREEGAQAYEALIPSAGSRIENPIRAGEEMRVPEEPKWLRFDRDRGWEYFVMVVSTEPQADFEEAGASLSRAEFERSLAEIESFQAPTSRSTLLEDVQTRTFFSVDDRDVALVVRLPLTHD